MFQFFSVQHIISATSVTRVTNTVLANLYLSDLDKWYYQNILILGYILIQGWVVHISRNKCPQAHLNFRVVQCYVAKSTIQKYNPVKKTYCLPIAWRIKVTI